MAKKSYKTLESIVESFKISKSLDLFMDNAISLVPIIDVTDEEILFKVIDFQSEQGYTIKKQNEPYIDTLLAHLKSDFNAKEYVVFKMYDKVHVAFLKYQIDSFEWKLDTQIIKFKLTDGDYKSFDYSDNKSVFRLFVDEDPEDEDSYIMDLIDIRTEEPLLEFSCIIPKDHIESEDGYEFQLEFAKFNVKEYTGKVWERIFMYDDFIYIICCDKLFVEIDDITGNVLIHNDHDRIVLPPYKLYALIDKLMNLNGDYED